MRIVFAGTPAFAEPALEGLIAARHELTLVLAQPDRPAGRGMKRATGAVKNRALAHGLEVFQPASLRDPAAVQRIAAARPEAIVTCAYGLILPQSVLEIPPLGALNIHASLLPRWRGAAPIQRALLAGDPVTGITIIRMDAGLDTGPVLAQRTLAITARDDAQTLQDKLAALGCEMIVGVLDELVAGQARPVPQPAEGATYAARIRKSDAMLDWSQPASALERAVRAFRPSPGACSWLRGEVLKIWASRLAEGRGEPGTVLAAGPGGVRIACGQDALEVTELQRPGGRRLPAGEFLRGTVIAPGERLATPR